MDYSSAQYHPQQHVRQHEMIYTHPQGQPPPLQGHDDRGPAGLGGAESAGGYYVDYQQPPLPPQDASAHPYHLEQQQQLQQLQQHSQRVHPNPHPYRDPRPYDQPQQEFRHEEQVRPRTGNGGPPRVKKVPVAKPPLPAGSVILDKSCLRCRLRKVKCDRLFPICTNCTDRKEDCDLGCLPAKSKAPTTLEAARIAKLEARLAELESQVAPSADGNPAAGDVILNIGPDSLDWRLATPQMATSLSQHLCEAFFNSCCSFLPAFRFFHDRLQAHLADPSKMGVAAKVAVAAFCAIGARVSPHSVRLVPSHPVVVPDAYIDQRIRPQALLGIASTPMESQNHPQAPLANAGARRQSACNTLVSQTYALAHEKGLMVEVTVENLAAILAVLQMTIFAEMQPKRSRFLLRIALGQFKDLQDLAPTEEIRLEIKKAFALALYASDSIIASYARRACLITGSDLLQYFSHVGLVVPRLPEDDIKNILDSILAVPNSKERYTTAGHLVSCCTFVCQGTFASIFAPPRKSSEELLQAIPSLWAAIDKTRAILQTIQTALYSDPPDLSSTKSHARGPGTHFHETDFLAKLIRDDRDLLDLISMIQVSLLELPAPGLPTLLFESTSRVRQGLKLLAFYAKIYIQGADVHMVFHHTVQMEHNPIWTTMALQRIGDPGGPIDASEEVSDVELAWFVEGLQHACFYLPAAEQRLVELAQRITPIPDDMAPSMLFEGGDIGKPLAPPYPEKEVDALPWLSAALNQPVRMDGFVDVNTLPRSGYGRTGSGSPPGEFNSASAQLLPPPDWAGLQGQGQA